MMLVQDAGVKIELCLMIHEVGSHMSCHTSELPQDAGMSQMSHLIHESRVFMMLAPTSSCVVQVFMMLVPTCSCVVRVFMMLVPTSSCVVRVHLRPAPAPTL